ncbi:hypothetical protein L1887_01824 [Cichorium endivia]|nr:hypothetical protein L1887_01824 [Cichorium endivia]
MDFQDSRKHSIPTGSREVYLCSRCGWSFPNAHPGAKRRRAHKKICGTIEGYTNLLDSKAISDDEDHLDDTEEKTTSFKQPPLHSFIVSSYQDFIPTHLPHSSHSS